MRKFKISPIQVKINEFIFLVLLLNTKKNEQYAIKRFPRLDIPCFEINYLEMVSFISDVSIQYYSFLKP